MKTSHSFIFENNLFVEFLIGTLSVYIHKKKSFTLQYQEMLTEKYFSSVINGVEVKLSLTFTIFVDYTISRVGMCI